MLSNPKNGDIVQVWYAKPRRHWPLHGKIGTVEIVCKGRPRSHCVRIEGELFAVPAGNLRKVQP